MDKISVSEQDFDVGVLYQRLTQDDTSVGGVAMFSGRVRDFNLQSQVAGLALEHYPGMTEKALEDIAHQARQRWPLGRVLIQHRVGEMYPGDNIVFVGVTSAHRQAAFDACQFIMDFLKTQAPFWKKELKRDGEAHWVEARDSDHEAADKWQ